MEAATAGVRSGAGPCAPVVIGLFLAAALLALALPPTAVGEEEAAEL